VVGKGRDGFGEDRSDGGGRCRKEWMRRTRTRGRPVWRAAWMGVMAGLLGLSGLVSVRIAVRRG
jgi:hypothetical protein